MKIPRNSADSLDTSELRPSGQHLPEVPLEQWLRALAVEQPSEFRALAVEQPLEFQALVAEQPLVFRALVAVEPSELPALVPLES